MSLETQGTALDTQNKTLSQLLSEQTGIPESQLTPEQISIFERLKQIDTQLDFLTIQTEQNLAEKIRLLNEMLEKAEEDNPGLPETVNNAVTEAATGAQAELARVIDDSPEAVSEWAAQQATTRVRGWLTSNIPFGLGESIGGVADSVGDPIKKIFLALTSAFGSFGIVKWLKDIFGWGTQENGEDTDTTGETDILTPANSPGEVDDEVPIDETLDTLHEGPLIDRYISGAKIIVALGINMGEERLQGTGETYSALQNMSYNDILNLDARTIPEGFYGSPELAEQKSELYNKIITSLTTHDTQELLRISLKTEALENIIAPNNILNESLFPYFGETPELGRQRLEEILENSRDSNFDWKDLSFEEISILFLYSFPALRIPVTAGMGELGNNIQDLILGDEMHEGLSSISEATIPSELMAGFAKLQGRILVNDSVQANNEASIKEDVFFEMPEENRERNEQIFESIMQFKRDVLSPSFYTHAKLGMSPEQQEVFTSHLSLASIIVLYGIMGGNSDLNTISGLALPPLIYTTGSILGAGGEENARVAGMYLGSYTTDALSDTDSPLSDDERIIMSIYAKKMLDVIVLQHLDTVAKMLGVAEGVTGLDLDELAMGTFIGGGVVRLGGGLIIRSALRAERISILGLGLKKIGNIGMLAGIALGGVSWFTSTRGGAFQRDFDSAIQGDDIRAVTQVLQRQQDSIRQIQTPDGQTISILAYPGDTPLYIINGKVYGLEVGDLNLIEKWNESDKEYLERIMDAAEGVLSSIFPSTGLEDGVDYTIQTHDGANVIFGEGENQVIIPMDDIISQSMVGNPEVLGEDFVRQITQGENTLPILGNEGQLGYIIQDMGGGKVMVLKELGPVEDLFTSHE